ncbi:MAG: hypothetical protein KTR25_06875 [Myxococcales bacterium]|nr:hypothetical protein [Myxococcales bacterium]
MFNRVVVVNVLWLIISGCLGEAPILTTDVHLGDESRVDGGLSSGEEVDGSGGDGEDVPGDQEDLRGSNGEDIPDDEENLSDNNGEDISDDEENLSDNNGEDILDNEEDLSDNNGEDIPDDEDNGVDSERPDAIVVELETLSAQFLFLPLVVQADPLASGGQYVVWPENHGQLLALADEDTEGQMAIPFILSKRTDVIFQVRAKLISNSDDSFYYRIDDGSWNEQNAGGTEGWEVLTPAIFVDLESGLHTLYILRREDGAQLDNVQLSVAAGAISTSASSLTLELESLAEQNSFYPFVTVYDPSASGEQYIMCLGESDSVEAPSENNTSGQISVSFVLNQLSDVVFQIRAKMLRRAKNSFYFRLDHGPWHEQNEAKLENWEVLTPSTFVGLSSGFHTLYIQQRRGDGAQLDRLTLSAATGSIVMAGN